MKILFFTAPWCGACTAIKPFVERAAGSAGVPVEYVNVDDDPDAAAKHGIRNLPTLLLLSDDGDVIDMIASSQINGRLPAALREARHD